MDRAITAVKCVSLASRMILESGGETYRAEETARRMFQGFGYRKIEVLAFPTGITFSLLIDEGNSITRIVRVPARNVNLARLEKCNMISREVASGALSPEEAYPRLKEIEAMKGAHPLVAALASGLTSAFFTLMFEGHAVDFPVAFLCAFLTQWILLLLRHREVPGVISGMVASFFTALIALTCQQIRPVFNIESIISGAIMPLVPGWALTNGIRDTIWGDLISGGAKTTEALLNAITLGAGIGIVMAVWGGMF